MEKEINIPEKMHITDKFIVCDVFLFLVIGLASAEQNWWQFRGPRGDDSRGLRREGVTHAADGSAVEAARVAGCDGLHYH